MNRFTRREALTRSMGGFGSVVLSWMLHENPLRAAGAPVYDLLPKAPHFAPKARSVIFIFMAGGPSQMDLLDPKPLLTKFDGMEPPLKVVSRRDVAKPKLMRSPFQFAKYGQSGIEVSELMPGLASVIDEVAVIRSGVTERIDHDTAQYHYMSGRNTTGFPAIGAWVAYGLGTENRNLPGYIALHDGDALIGPRAWTSGWLPPSYQGTLLDPEGVPIPDLKRPASLSLEDERSVIGMVNGLNRLSRNRHPELLELDSRIANYELAARMQLAIPQATDLNQETAATQAMYGVDRKECADFARACLLSRRLLEHGVRFIQLWSGAAFGTEVHWDAHGSVPDNHRRESAKIDQPVAALLRDLRQRGMFDDTLVIFNTEFGRTPYSESAGDKVGPGRDHNPDVFSVWLAGAGLKHGIAYGSSDDIGWKVAENPVDVHDFHATILHLLGIDHTRLTFYHNGIERRLTDVHGNVLSELMS